MKVRKFLGALVAIILLWFAFDRIGGEVMWWLNQHSQDTTSPKIKAIVAGLPEDVILMGTSRCNGHYVPSILSDSLGMSVYNAGIDGSDNIFAQYMVLRYVLRHHVPRIVCLEVQNSFLDAEEDSYHTTGYFAPYLGQDEAADSVFRKAGDYWLYRLSHLYRYNTKVLANITGQFRHYWDQAEQGYIPYPQPAEQPKLERWEPDDPSQVNPDKKEYLVRFIQVCRDSHVFLCFTISPAYAKVDTSFYAGLRGVAAAYQIPLLDYHTSQTFLDHPDYFRDSYHLWDRGARHYSSMFASDLKRLFRE